MHIDVQEAPITVNLVKDLALNAQKDSSVMKLISIQRSVHRVIIVQQVLMSHLNAQLVHLVEL